MCTILDFCLVFDHNCYLVFLSYSAVTILLLKYCNKGWVNKGPYKEDVLLIRDVILDDWGEKETFWGRR